MQLILQKTIFFINPKQQALKNNESDTERLESF